MTALDLLAEGTVTVEGAYREFGISRTALYRLMDGGDLPYSQLKAYRRRLIPRRALKAMLSEAMRGKVEEGGDGRS